MLTSNGVGQSVAPTRLALSDRTNTGGRRHATTRPTLLFLSHPVAALAAAAAIAGQFRGAPKKAKTCVATKHPGVLRPKKTLVDEFSNKVMWSFSSGEENLRRIAA